MLSNRRTGEFTEPSTKWAFIIITYHYTIQEENVSEGQKQAYGHRKQFKGIN